MDFELQNIITYVVMLIGFITTYWKSKVSLEKRLTSMSSELEDRKVQIDRLERAVGKLESTIDKILQQRTEFEKQTLEQFSTIQLQLSEVVKEQVVATTILTENLKHLTDLVQRHDEKLNQLKP